MAEKSIRNFNHKKTKNTISFLQLLHQVNASPTWGIFPRSDPKNEKYAKERQVCTTKSIVDMPLKLQNAFKWSL